MNKNTSSLPPASRLRPTAPKPGGCGVCTDLGLRAGIARWAGATAPQRRLALRNEVFWYDANPYASAVSSQTVSPERIQSGYFPL
jgi:hypothetical protein